MQSDMTGPPASGDGLTRSVPLDDRAIVIALGPEWLKPDTILTWLGPWALVGLAH